MLNSSEPSLRRRITEYYIRQIESGKLHPGDRLPSTGEIARRFRTVDSNVHHALLELVRRKLILRRPRVGTVVLGTRRNLRDVAVFVSWETLQRNEEFTRLLTGMLIEKLQRRMVSCRIIYDTQDHSGLEQIRRMATAGEIDGVIMRNYSASYLPLLQRMPIPHSAIPHVLDATVRELMLRTAAESGCSRIAIIDPSAIRDATDGICMNSRLAKKYGLTLRSSWYCTPRALGMEMPLLNYSKFGWLAFDHLWRQEEHPDGIILLSDSLISGLYMAASFHHVRLGIDYVVVSHHTRENGVLIPFNCFLIQHSIAEMAEVMIEHLFAAAIGAETEEHRLAVRVVNHRPGASGPPLP